VESRTPSVGCGASCRRKTALAILPDKRFKALLRAYNNTPRKCLDFKTPAEAFSQALHFECESTFPLTRE